MAAGPQSCDVDTFDASLPASSAPLALTRRCELAPNGVRVCVVNSTHGLVIVPSAVVVQHGSMLMMRISGPHPQTAYFTGEYATFRICLPGEYVVHIRLFMTRPGLVGGCNGSWHRNESYLLERFGFHVNATSTPSDCACLWTWQEEVGTAAGRRPTAVDLRSRPARESLSTFAASPHRMAQHMAASFSQLRFQDTTSAQYLDRSSWQHSTEHFPSCLFGDSHMRNLANSLIALATPGCDPLVAQETKGLCRTQNIALNAPELVHFERVEDADGLRRALQNVSMCKSVVVGYGYHMLAYNPSHRVGRPPMLPQQYAAAVNASLHRIRSVFMRRTVMPRILWLSLNPAPLFLPYELLKQSPSARTVFSSEEALLAAWHGHHPLSHQLSCPDMDWRLPHTIARYNGAAREVVKAIEGVEFFDTWPVAFPLFDLSFDGRHCQYPIGPHLAARLLSRLLPVGGG